MSDGGSGGVEQQPRRERRRAVARLWTTYNVVRMLATTRPKISKAEKSVPRTVAPPTSGMIIVIHQHQPEFGRPARHIGQAELAEHLRRQEGMDRQQQIADRAEQRDRKSTRLNSSH